MKRQRLIALSLVLLLFLTGCSAESESTSKEPEKIIVPLLVSHVLYESSQEFQTGLEVAKEMFAKTHQGRYTLETELFFCDDYESAVQNAEKLAKRREVTTVIISLESHEAIRSVTEVLRTAGQTALILWGCDDEVLSRKNEPVFGGFYTGADYGAAMASYVKQSGKKRCAVYYTDTDYNRGEAAAFERALLDSSCEVVDFAAETRDQTEFQQIFARWSALDVDAVYLCTNDAAAGYRNLAWLRKLDPGRRMMVVANPVMDNEVYLAKNSEVAEGIIIGGQFPVGKTNRTDLFEEIYQEKKRGTNTLIDVSAVYVCDMVSLLAEAKVRSEAEAISPAEWIRSNSYQGALALWQFDIYGRLRAHPENDPYFYAVALKEGYFIVINAGGNEK